MDVHVGSRLRSARLLAGYSQGKLAAFVGLTFQQVQKYEKGMNRIGASRLQQFAELLNVSPAYFFEGVDGAQRAPQPATANDLSELLDAGIEGDAARPQRQALDLLHHFGLVRDPATRASIVHLVKAAAAGATHTGNAPL
ncbi:MAG: helix-turn-helix transcriptional regulator [Ferrovibrio sp.]|nr:helix-turn-helix transcriptional regulator [Ferrovibrio sp.]